MQIALDSTAHSPLYLLITYEHILQCKTIEDFLKSALIKMGGGNGPTKPDNPPAMLQERVPIPAELHDCASYREMRGQGNVAHPLLRQGFFVILQDTNRQVYNLTTCAKQERRCRGRVSSPGGYRELDMLRHQCRTRAEYDLEVAD